MHSEDDVRASPENTIDNKLVLDHPLDGLVRALARITAHAAYKANVTIDMDDPEVAREMLLMTFDAVFRSETRNG